MSLANATRLGPYEVVALLGAGGMGEVYRARDSRLGRDVALKLLPAAFTADTERLARFRREAQVLASLNHPHIGAIYGLEETDGVLALVLELVEGEDLAQRLLRGPLPLDEALVVARQIAEALEEAHGKGVVHRDLKPANVKLGADGRVKVLDFGLAKALSGDVGAASGPDLSASPTGALRATQAGVILGTAAYMSPEQARGKTLDKRTDIWALGVVLFEMLTGRQLFLGETVSDTLAAVLRKDVEWGTLPEETPSSIRALLRRCLQRDPRQRLHDVADARIVLEEDPEPLTSPAAGPSRARWPRWAPIAALLALVVAAFLGALMARRQSASPQAPARVLRAGLLPPSGVTVPVNAETPAVMTPSPDGNLFVFGGLTEKGTRLYVQDLRSGRTQMLEGTDTAQYPFWSPDSRWIGYFTQPDGALKKIEAGGGVPITLCAADDGKGGAWSANGTILFAPTYSSPLFRIAASGGSPQALTRIDEKLHDSHRHPRFLPDGRHFLYLARSNNPDRPSSILLGSLDGGEPRVVLANDTLAEFASGHLLFARQGTVFAQPFDLDRRELRGAPQPVAPTIALGGSAFAAMAASTNGLLVTHTASVVSETALEWRDRHGNVQQRLGEPMVHVIVALAPDEKSAIVASSRGTDNPGLWTVDFARNLITRLSQEGGDQSWPVWARDGRSFFYYSNRSSTFGIYRRSLDQMGETAAVLTSSQPVTPSGITPDGRVLVYSRREEGGNEDLWHVSLEGESREPEPLLRTRASERNARVSPDGKWMAYESRERSGRAEVYLAPFPGSGSRVQASVEGGSNPVWRSDGGELFYLQPDGALMAVSVRAAGGLALDPPRKLFVVQPGRPFAVASRGERFLVIPVPDRVESPPAHLVVNWPSVLSAALETEPPR